VVAIQQLPTASEELPRRAPCNLAPLHRDLAPIPAWQVPVVAMATLVDPILPAIERDRIAYVAFALLNKTDGRKAAQKKGREVRRLAHSRPPFARQGVRYSQSTPQGSPIPTTNERTALNGRIGTLIPQRLGCSRLRP